MLIVGILLAVMGACFVVFGRRITRAGQERQRRRGMRTSSRTEARIVLIVFLAGGVLLFAAGVGFATGLLEPGQDKSTSNDSWPTTIGVLVVGLGIGLFLIVRDKRRGE